MFHSLYSLAHIISVVGFYNFPDALNSSCLLLTLIPDSALQNFFIHQSEHSRLGRFRSIYSLLQ